MNKPKDDDSVARIVERRGKPAYDVITYFPTLKEAFKAGKSKDKYLIEAKDKAGRWICVETTCREA